MNGWQVSREALLDAVEVLELVPQRLGIPSSGFFRVENLGNGKTRWMVASDATCVFTLAGTGDWPKPKGYFYLNRQIFSPFVQAAKEIRNKSPFEFSLNGKSLVLRHGHRRRATFVNQPDIEGYGGILEANSLRKLEVSEHAKNLIYCARECASVDQLKPELHCVCVSSRNGTVNVLATNKKVLFCGHSKSDGKDKTVPLPLFLVTLLGSRQLKSIEYGKELVVLSFPGGRIWQPVASRAHLFPKDSMLERVVDGSKKRVLFRVETRKLATALQRLGLYLQALKREDWVLEIKGQKGAGELALHSKVSYSDFLERVPIDGELEQDVSLSWPLDMLIPIMDYVGKAGKKLWLEVRLWSVKNKQGSTVKASYIKTGDIQLVVSTKA